MLCFAASRRGCLTQEVLDCHCQHKRYHVQSITACKGGGQWKSKHFSGWAGKGETGEIRLWANVVISWKWGWSFPGNTEQTSGCGDWTASWNNFEMSYKDRVLFHSELGNEVFGKKANSFLGEIPLYKLQNRSPIKETAQIDSFFHSTYHCWSITYMNQQEMALVKIHMSKRCTSTE